MNIKKIAYILVAAVLVLGFTACSQTMTYKTPMGLTAVVDKTDYLVGEEFDPSTATVTVTFTDNSTATFKGSELSYTMYEGGTAATDNDLTIKANSYVSFSYGGKEVVVSNKAAINPRTAVSVVLSNLPETTTTDGKKVNAPDVSAVTGVMTLDNGATREVSVADGSINVTPVVTGITAEAAENVSIDYTVTTYGSKPVDDVAPENGYKINVTLDKGDFNEEVAAYTFDVVYYLDGKELKTADEPSATKKDGFYLGQNLTWKVVLSDGNTTKDVDITSSDYYAVNGVSLTPNRNILGRNTEKTITIKYLGEKYADKIADKDIEVYIPNGKNYIESVTYTGTDYKAVEGGKAIAITDLKFNVQWKETPTEEQANAGEKWEATSSTVSFVTGTETLTGLEAGDTYKPTFSWSWDGINGKQYGYQQLSLEVSAK